MRRAFPFTDFSGFLRLYLAIASCLRQAEDFAEIVEALGAGLHAQGVGYAEVTFTPALHRSRGVPDAVMIAGLVAGRRAILERHDVLVRWVFDVVRIFPEQAEPTLAFARAMEAADPGATVGLGLAGPEDRPHAIAPLVPTFARARAEGLHVLPHAMPAGTLWMEPSPKSRTVSAYWPAATGANAACTLAFADSAISQACVPVQAPVQPLKR